MKAGRAGAWSLVVAASLVFATPASGLDRRAPVSGGLVADVAEDDGGTLVTMERAVAGLRLQYKAIFWRGNHGIIHDAVVESCGSERGTGAKMPRAHAAPKMRRLPTMGATTIPNRHDRPAPSPVARA
jgi:hypothetical protein